MPGPCNGPRALRVNASDSTGGWWGVVWPIGGIYLSTVNTDPATLFEFGTWQVLGAGSLLMTAPGPVVVNSVESGPASVHVTPIPTIPIYGWQRVS